jgi:hypothetical protein
VTVQVAKIDGARGRVDLSPVELPPAPDA